MPVKYAFMQLKLCLQPDSNTEPLNLRTLMNNKPRKNKKNCFSHSLNLAHAADMVKRQ